MNRIVKCRVENEFIRGAGQVIGAAGSHDDVELELEFSEMWHGTSRTVMWFDALGENPVMTLLTTDLLAPGEAEVYRVPVPGECKAIEGDMMVTIRGATVTGDVESRAVVAATATFRVLPALWDEDAQEAGDVTPSVADQLQAEIEEIKEGIVLAAAAADAKAAAEKAAKDAADEAAAAGKSAEAAEKAREQAALAVGKTSYIGENNHWYEWDPETGAFVDSGVPATGLYDENGGRQIRMWFGTVEEYNALTHIDPAVYYNILEG